QKYNISLPCSCRGATNTRWKLPKDSIHAAIPSSRTLNLLAIVEHAVTPKTLRRNATPACIPCLWCPEEGEKEKRRLAEGKERRGEGNVSRAKGEENERKGEQSKRRGEGKERRAEQKERRAEQKREKRRGGESRYRAKRKEGKAEGEQKERR
ncbi:Hypothetical predicted protein, partial [Pelobates cultripes]